MKMLMCHDGSSRTEEALRFAAVIAKACKADVTLLGVASSEGADTQALLGHLEKTRDQQQREGLQTQLLAKTGSPVQEILGHEEQAGYDIVVLGAGRTQPPLTGKTYELVRQIKPTVLLVTGGRESVRRILICTSGAPCSEEPIRAAADIAKCTQAKVILLHILPDAPPVYSSIIAQEETVEQILQSGSALGRNLQHQKEMLEKSGVEVSLQVRHGDVADEVLNEAREQDVDLIVVGSTADRGPLYQYLLGDCTRQIVIRTPCPVLIARHESLHAQGGFWQQVGKLFGAGGEK
jgi:nucleotide-binding universal stress UspA family protein